MKMYALSNLAVAGLLGGLLVLPAAGVVQARSHVQPAIDNICRRTMRTSPDTADYGACTDSLTATAARIAQSQVTAQAQQACHARGLQGPQLAMCIVDGRRQAAAAPLSIDTSVVKTGAKAYGWMNFKDQHQSEEWSCAALGLQPDGGAFRQCVHSLDAAMFNADNPQG